MPARSAACGFFYLAASPQAGAVATGFAARLMCRSVAVIASALLLAVLGNAAVAEEPANSDEVLTVDQAVQIAIANNRNLKIVSLSLDSSKEKLAAEKTRRLPSFNTYVFASQLLQPINFTVQAGQFGTYAGIGPIPATNTNITTPSQPTAYIFGTASQPLLTLVQDQHPHPWAGALGRTGRPEGARGAHLDCR